MPRLSDSTIISRALTPAILDRESYAQSYGGRGPEAEAATALTKAFELLRRKRLKSYTDADWETARLALLYAEQWDASLADANQGLVDEKDLRRSAETFREMRHRVWGRSALEAALAEGKAVPLHEIVATVRRLPADGKLD